MCPVACAFIDLFLHVVSRSHADAKHLLSDSLPSTDEPRAGAVGALESDPLTGSLASLSMFGGSSAQDSPAAEGHADDANDSLLSPFARAMRARKAGGESYLFSAQRC